MNSSPSRVTPKPEKNSLMAISFVCKFIPFVVYLNSIFIPFICKNIPNSRFKPIRQRVRGFTLIELVVTMAVAAILVAVAVPNMRTFIQNGRLSTQANDLIGDLSLARSEAIKRRSNVGICKSTNGTTCTVAGDWRDGRAIFVDANNDGDWDAGPDETILRFREPLASTGDTLNANPAAVPNPIIFGANGASNVPVGAVGSLVFCDDRGQTKGRQVNLNVMGQAAVVTSAPVTCTP